MNFTDLESIQHNKLSSHYGLNLSFSRRFPCITGQSFFSVQTFPKFPFLKGQYHALFQELYLHIDKNSEEKV